MTRELATMLIVECNGTFEEYLASLSKKSRKQYSYVQKHNADLHYEEIPYNEELVGRYMALWQRQLVRGQPIEWAFPIGTVTDWAQRGELLVFKCERAVQFIQKRDGYWDCHPPMYEKTEENMDRYLAKWMWFELLRFAHENQLGVLNLGGGVDVWREHIRRRDEFPNPRYKWQFVPDNIKDNPETAPNYAILDIHGKHILQRLD